MAAYAPSITYTTNANDSSIVWYSPDSTWTSWNGPYTTYTTSSSYADIIWVNWISVGSITVGGTAPNVANQITPEQLAATEARLLEQYRREQAAADKAAQRRVQATGRARALLDSLLSKDQRKTLAEQQFFDLEIESRDGTKRRYRIRQGRSGNVDLLSPEGKPIRRYCAHPILLVPDEDTMLTQKLMLETAEEQFLKTANCRELAS